MGYAADEVEVAQLGTLLALKDATAHCCRSRAGPTLRCSFVKAAIRFPQEFSHPDATCVGREKNLLFFRADGPHRHSQDVTDAAMDYILDEFENLAMKWAPKPLKPRRTSHRVNPGDKMDSGNGRMI